MNSEGSSIETTAPASRIEFSALIFSALSALVLICAAILATFSVGEIAGRENVLSILTGGVTSMKSEFVERVGVINLVVKDADGARYAEIFNSQRQELLLKIERTENIKKALQTLIALGSNTERLSSRMLQFHYLEMNESDSPNGNPKVSVRSGHLCKRPVRDVDLSRAI